jgi:PKD repeat protein
MKYITQICYLLGIAMLLTSCKSKNDPKPEPDNTTAATLADFTWTGTQEVNHEIQMVNSSKNADSYKWDFGNGVTSAKQTPDKITYATEGAYTVTLTATKGNNKSISTKTIVIAYYNLPIAHFSYSFKDKKSAAPATVRFKNESVNGGTYKWTIKGNDYYTPNPQDITFNQPGNYMMTLLVTSENGDFQSMFSEVITVESNADPIASFALAYHPYPYQVNEPIQLVNKSQNADSWLWTFGTGGPAASTEEHPEVKFTAPGNYTITLVAKKGLLQSAPRSTTLKINP